MREQVRSIDRKVPLADAATMQLRESRAVARQRFSTLLLGVFAVVALLLAGIGLYGVMAFLVTQREREIGIRLALGGRPGDVLRLVFGEGVTITALGVAAGLGGAVVLSRLMAGMLFGVAPRDPVTFGAIAVVLAAVSLVACWIPARRATQVDPLDAMRAE